MEMGRRKVLTVSRKLKLKRDFLSWLGDREETIERVVEYLEEEFTGSKFTIVGEYVGWLNSRKRGVTHTPQWVQRIYRREMK